jgi:methyl-accepting chemotaxis protein
MKSIRLKIISIIIICIIIFGGIIAWFSISRSTELLERQATDLIAANTDSISNQIEAENRKVEATVSAVGVMMANNFEFEAASSSRKYLQERLVGLAAVNKVLLDRSNKSGGGAMSIYATFNVEIFKEVFETWHTMQNGVATEMEDEPLELFDDPKNPDMAWYFDPVREKKGVWTTTYEDAITKIPMYSYVEPSIGSNGEIVGIVGMDVSLEGISKFVLEHKTMDSGFSFLIDRDNDFIVEPKGTIRQPLLGALLKAKDKEPRGIISNEKSIIAYSRLPNKQTVATYILRSDVLDDINALKRNLVFFMAIMVAIAAIVGYLLISPTTSKINQLKTAAELAGEDEASAAILTIKSRDEIGQLANSFGTMLGKIKMSRIALEENNRNLEIRVQERTRELEKNLEEMEKFNKLTIDRELKMIEMKEELRKYQDGLKK